MLWQTNVRPIHSTGRGRTHFYSTTNYSPPPSHTFREKLKSRPLFLFCKGSVLEMPFSEKLKLISQISSDYE